MSNQGGEKKARGALLLVQNLMDLVLICMFCFKRLDKFWMCILQRTYRGFSTRCALFVIVALVVLLRCEVKRSGGRNTVLIMILDLGGTNQN